MLSLPLSSPLCLCVCMCVCMSGACLPVLVQCGRTSGILLHYSLPYSLKIGFSLNLVLDWGLEAPGPCLCVLLTRSLRLTILNF